MHQTQRPLRCHSHEVGHFAYHALKTPVWFQVTPSSLAFSSSFRSKLPEPSSSHCCKYHIVVSCKRMTMITNVFDHPNVTGLCPSAIFPLRYCIPSVALWQRTRDWWMVWIFWCGFLQAESDWLVSSLEFDTSSSLCSYCIFLLTNLTDWLKFHWIEVV